MSNAVLIIGESGTGKSTAIRTLPPAETFILNITDKPLPFKGSRKLYQNLSSDGLTGNYYSTDNFVTIVRIIKLVNHKRPDIKYLIIDDFGLTILNQNMRKAMVKGYDKFSELGKDVGEVIDLVTSSAMRHDLNCVVTMHTDINEHGLAKPKTIGKVIDKNVCIEAKFTWVFHSYVSDGHYKFITNNDGLHLAKSSMGCFSESMIDNDLLAIFTTINNYTNEDIQQ